MEAGVGAEPLEPPHFNHWLRVQEAFSKTRKMFYIARHNVARIDRVEGAGGHAWI